MIPLTLRITNFRSVKKMQTFTFPRQPGLYFMQGVNAAEPRLEANGAGKSTLWEALTWCWYGKTSRGLKAGDVCNWGADKGTCVEFDFELEDGYVPFTLRRTWGPNSWELIEGDGVVHDLVKEKDNPALAWLALAFEPWLNCILTAQNQPMFLDLKRDAQAALFSDVMGLDLWLDYSARASKAASAQDRKSRDLERELAHARGQLEAIGKQDFKESAASFERKRRERLEALEQQHDNAMRGRKTLKQEMERLEVRATEAAEYAARCRAVLSRLHEAQPGDKVCPACGQKVHSLKKISEDERIYDDARIELDAAQRKAANARRDFEMVDRQLDEIERDAERVQQERNPYDEMEERALADARRLRQQIDNIQDDLDASNERCSLLQFWVRGFKEVRLSLIAEALTELEIEVNSCCDALGLVGWELQFQVDRETKSGSIQRGFNCYVKSPHNDQPVPWEAWSGGEAQRLRLAATMGLADLIRSRTGTPLALEVWDEPTNGLSPQGIRDLLECLAERAQREQRQLWIVDHKSHEFGGFAGGAVITKTANGSAITTY